MGIPSNSNGCTCGAPNRASGLQVDFCAFLFLYFSAGRHFEIPSLVLKPFTTIFLVLGPLLDQLWLPPAYFFRPLPCKFVMHRSLLPHNLRFSPDQFLVVICSFSVNFVAFQIQWGPNWLPAHHSGVKASQNWRGPRTSSLLGSNFMVFHPFYIDLKVPVCVCFNGFSQ